MPSAINDVSVAAWIAIVAAVMTPCLAAYLAHRRGYNPLAWLLGSGCLSLVVLWCMPDVSHCKPEDDYRRKWRKIGSIWTSALIASNVVVALIAVQAVSWNLATSEVADAHRREIAKIEGELLESQAARKRGIKAIPDLYSRATPTRPSSQLIAHYVSYRLASDLDRSLTRTNEEREESFYRILNAATAMGMPFRFQQSAFSDFETADFCLADERIVTNGLEGTAVWDAGTGRRILEIPQDEKRLRGPLVLCDGGAHVLIDYSTRISLYSARDGSLVATLLETEVEDAVVELRIGSTRRYAIAFVDGGDARYWDLRTGREVDIPYLGELRDAAFLPGGESALLFVDKEVSMLNFSTRESAPSGLTSVLTELLDDPKREAIADASGGVLQVRDGDSVDLYSIALKKKLCRLPSPAILSPDGSRAIAPIANGSSYGLFYAHGLYDTSNGSLLRTIVLAGRYDPVVAFSSDGKRVAVGAGSCVTVHHTEGGHVESVLVGHSGVVNDVVFALDGRHVASASDDGTARLWHLFRPGFPVDNWSFAGHYGAVDSVQFSGDGKRLLTVSLSDGTARVWDIGLVKAYDPTGQPEIWRSGPKWIREYGETARFGASYQEQRPDPSVLRDLVAYFSAYEPIELHAEENRPSTHPSTTKGWQDLYERMTGELDPGSSDEFDN